MNRRSASLNGARALRWLAIVIVLNYHLAVAETPIIHWIKHFHVDSEAINFIGYHHKTHTLEVQFHSGDTYRYASVPLSIFNDFKASESKGRYFRENIRGRYDYWKVEPK